MYRTRPDRVGTMDIYALLKQLVEKDGSDLYLATGAAPSAKFAGELTPLSDTPFKSGEVEALARSVMNEEQREEFERELEMNLAIAPEGIGRFRLNIFKQRNEVSLVARNIQTEIPRFDDLGLPAILKEVITAKNGLVLFVGGTGSGKSTSLAALIDHRNAFKGGHIITIEDPVEYVHPHKKCIVNQREVGVDTMSFHAALKNTLRQAPDVILIGEIRDQETMEHALAFAETGHLAISTLHANNANQAIDRIINFFPEERKAQLLHDLGNNIRAIVSQRLVPTVDGKRCAAIEILLGSHTIKQMIMKGQLSDLKEAMQKSENQGMMTFDSALFELVRKGRISEEEALKNADSANNLRLRLKLSGKGAPEQDETELVLRDRVPEKTSDRGEGTAAELSLDVIDENDENDENEGGEAAGTSDARTAPTPDRDIHAMMKRMEAQMSGGAPAAGAGAEKRDVKPTARAGDGVADTQVTNAATSTGDDAATRAARAAAKIAQLRAAKAAKAVADTPSGTGAGLSAAAAAFELTLEPSDDPAAESGAGGADGDRTDETPGSGMGRVA